MDKETKEALDLVDTALTRITTLLDSMSNKIIDLSERASSLELTQRVIKGLCETVAIQQKTINNINGSLEHALNLITDLKARVTFLESKVGSNED